MMYIPAGAVAVAEVVPVFRLAHGRVLGRRGAELNNKHVYISLSLYIYIYIYIGIIVLSENNNMFYISYRLKHIV